MWASLGMGIKGLSAPRPDATHGPLFSCPVSLMGPTRSQRRAHLVLRCLEMPLHACPS
jgi:hypothetical protein